MRNLVLLTSNFPYGNGETFLKSEIPYLSKCFEKVFILPSHLFSNNQIFIVPKNVEILKGDFELKGIEKLFAIRFLFSKVVLEELIQRRRNGMRWNFVRFKTMLSSHVRAKKIARFISKFDFGSETVYYSYWCDDSAIALAHLKLKNAQIKCISRAHGWDVYEEVSSIKYLPFRSFIKEKLDAIYPVSLKGEKEILEKWGRNEHKRVFHKYLGVNVNNVLNPERSDKRIRIVSCSNLIPLKRVHLIIEALSKAPLNLEMEWNHFGYGPLYGNLVERCKQEFQSNVFFHFHGNVENAYLMKWYEANHVDVFINVSETEGIPVSIMEAMSKSIPVMATDVGGNSEIVNEQNGILLPSNLSSEQLLNEILAFNTLSEQQIDFKRKSAFLTWERKFNAEKNYPHFVNQLQDI